MTNYIIQVSDDALMEMSLVSLEGYIVPMRSPKPSKKSHDGLEACGLLWGHQVVLPDGDILYSVEKLTVDSMAYRCPGEVWPSNGLGVIKDLITSYWPKYEFLGDFHTHPYEHYTEVKELQGWEFSEADRRSMVYKASTEIDFRLSLVMTISSLKRATNRKPDDFTHYITWDFNNYRFWLNACVVHRHIDDDPEADGFEPEDDVRISLYPNGSDWAEKYSECDEVEGIFLHCPYLSPPWAVTEFGRKAGRNHEPGL